MNRANRAPSSSKCNSLMHKNIHFGFNWCVASHLCSTQINSKSSKSRKFVCYEPLLKFPEHQFLCSVSVQGPRASQALSMLGSFPGALLIKFETYIEMKKIGLRHINSSSPRLHS